MLFGSIGYLNLLPFQIYLKRRLPTNSAKMALRYKRATPAKINRAMRLRHIDAAFVSSIESPRYRCSDLGIIAKGAVYSVLLLPKQTGDDPASATSNILKKVLNLNGRVLIGDSALRYYLEGGEAIDLADTWHRQKGLPFVFARLCFNRHEASVRKVAKDFVRRRIKIPQYILKKEAKKRSVSARDLSWYLQCIHYNIDTQAQRGLRKFLKSAKRFKTNN